jgi:carnitine O-acetyltransferase
MFHACRIAQETQDAYRIHDPSRYTHAVVACRNQFFAVPVFNENGDILPLSIMEANLKKCQEQAKHTNPDSLELGWLTTWNRDDWALARNKLLRLGGPSMQRALELLESGMLVLSLDEEEPVSYRQRALEYWHGGVNSGGNRYFDKSIHLVVSKNGKLGYIGEHSLMDGMPAVGLCNFIQKETYQKQLNMEESDDSMSSVASSQEVENIFDDAFANLAKEGRLEIASLITYAMKDFKQLINDHDLHVESFQGYGSSFIKNAGHSPDAYVQMAIQLATYRLFGKQVATYESTQVRSFLHGRTEVTRSVSKASEAFVKAMGMESSGDDELDRDVRKEKLELFRKATESHVVYIRKAIVGQGCDRHFMGLSMMVDEGEEAPALFSHPLFARSKRWRVSTSTLPNMPGFGPVEEDGVGIAYEIKPNCVMFTITGRREREFTEALCHRIEEALVEIQSLVDMEEPQRSKL